MQICLGIGLKERTNQPPLLQFVWQFGTNRSAFGDDDEHSINHKCKAVKSSSYGQRRKAIKDLVGWAKQELESIVAEEALVNAKDAVSKISASNNASNISVESDHLLVDVKSVPA